MKGREKSDGGLFAALLLGAVSGFFLALYRAMERRRGANAFAFLLSAVPGASSP